MDGFPTGFWGKLRKTADGAVEAWHPLVDHCADVAACCEVLLERTLLRRRLARLAGLEDLSPVHRARLCVLAALHDAGKVNLGFQRKAEPNPRYVTGHVRPLFALLASRLREGGEVLSALGTDEILEWGPEGLLFAALAHHGQPLAADAHGSEADPAIWRKAGPLDPVAALRELAACARSWYPDATLQEASLPAAPEFQHAFSGLVTLADWLGSDTGFFPFSEDGARDRMTFARESARAAIRAIGLDSEPARSQLVLGPGWFEKFMEFPPHGTQRAVMALPVPARGGLAVLEAETGSGKTEAALARFLALFAAGAVDGLYFALPTRTAATQMQERVVRKVELAFPEPDARPPVILAVPGYVRVDDIEGTRGDPQLPPFHTLWPEDMADRVRWRGWAAERPKRYLAGEIVVGTVDQVLLSALRVKHAHLRATSLVRHLLVVDEVHASDAYMNHVLELVLERHLAAGGHALLMSATLGAAARQRFVAPDSPAPPPLREAAGQPYPALSLRQDGGSMTIPAGSAARGKSVRVEIAAEISNAEEIAMRALEAGRQGGRVLVIRNTVGDAIETQLALEVAAGDADSSLLFSCARAPGVAAPHHSRYAREDRKALDGAIELRFGKGAVGACVAIATQTVQQSLDLDADLLITDLCPMDVLLQRIGRLHRHERSRPPPFERGRVVVLVPEDAGLEKCISKTGEPRGRHGIGRVYPDLRILQATWDLLVEHGELAIPERNRTYVEGATHPEALAEVVARGGHWRAHRNWIAGKLMAEVGLASLNEASWEEPFGARGWSRDDGRIATRLGAGDRVVLFEEPFETPFGARASAINMPAWMAATSAEGDEPRNVRARHEGGVTFELGARSYTYDRLGLRVTRSAERDTLEEDSDG